MLEAGFRGAQGKGHDETPEDCLGEEASELRREPGRKAEGHGDAKPASGSVRFGD
jgi:hypothetical protein